MLLAINTDPDAERTAWVTIDDGLHRVGDELTCVYSTDGPTGQVASVEPKNGKAVRLTLPPAGFVIYAAPVR